MANKGAHRDDDKRACTGVTKVQNQSSVFVNDKLWAVLGTEEQPGNHGGGPLINTSGDTVRIENQPVIVHGPDLAGIDGEGHALAKDETGEGSDNVFAYRGGAA